MLASLQSIDRLEQSQEINVLLVEDNLAEARLLQEILKETLDSQFALVHVKRLGEGIAQLERTHFNVALLDLTLPDSEGLASLDVLIQHAPSLPIVVLTNTNDDRLALDAVRHGAQDYLVKRQVNLDNLVRAVRYAIERKQAAEDLREANENLELRVRERTAALAAANKSLHQEIESRQNIQNRLELAQQAGKIGTFEWDLADDTVTWSSELEALYGLNSGSLGNNHAQLLELVHPDDRASIASALRRSRQQQQGLDLEFRVEDGDGNIRWMAVKSSIFPDPHPTRTLALAKPLEQKTAPSAIGIHMDITEKKQLEAQFLRAQRLESLGTLASGIAHDLNNVLTPILSVAQLLPLRLSGIDDRTQNLLQILETSARRGADLIKQILSFARGIEGKRVCLQPSHLLVEIHKILQQTLPKSIEIDIDIAPELWTISGDMTQIHQVLMNLCVNARDAMPQGGMLAITANNLTIDEGFARTHLEAQVGTYVKIAVTDTGTGIQPQLLHRIFDPFFTTKEIGKGTGLGLSAVLGIVKAHGGFIDVQSQIVGEASRNENQGTQISVYLPTCNAPDRSIENAPELPSGRQQTILVVDDEKAIGELIKTTLETFDYRVVLASNGAEAIEIYAQQHDDIDAALIDMMMPVMDGLATATALLHIESNLPIVASSGLHTVEAVDRAERFGCRYFLAKPFTASDLLQVLSQAIAKGKSE